MYTRTHHSDSPQRPSQQGFVLIVALILLMVLTILGLAAAQNTSLEERMAGNARNHDLAFQAAEAGLRAAEGCLNQGLAVCSNFSADANGTYTFVPPATTSVAPPLWNQPGFWSNAGNVLGYTTITSARLRGLAGQPEIIIEQMPPLAAPGNNLGQQQFGGGSPSIQLYRITALGTGGDKSSTALLQSTFQQ